MADDELRAETPTIVGKDARHGVERRHQPVEQAAAEQTMPTELMNRLAIAAEADDMVERDTRKDAVRQRSVGEPVVGGHRRCRRMTSARCRKRTPSPQSVVPVV